MNMDDTASQLEAIASEDDFALRETIPCSPSLGSARHTCDLLTRRETLKTGVLRLPLGLDLIGLEFVHPSAGGFTQLLVNDCSVAVGPN